MARRNEAIAARFGRNLFRCRRRLSMSQEELSQRASIHRTEVSQLERGLRVPRIDTLLKLAATLEVAPNQLLDGIAWVPGDYRRGEFTFPSALDSTAPGRIGGKDG